MRARDAIDEAIRDHGPIRFDEFMELALYGEGGFYERPPVGPDRAFVTSPHVHPVFAELLTRAIADLGASLGRPDPLRIAEVGAGDGTLARSLLEHLPPIPHTYRAVERSPGARAALAGIEGVEVSERLDGSPHVVIANELLDNLPFRRFRPTPRGPMEVAVGADGERLVEVLVDATDAPSTDAAREGILPVGALAFVDEIAARLADPGYALLIDYGGVGDQGGATHGYREHRPVEDLLAAPGETDITVGVDFAAIGSRAERAGLTAFPSITQRHALTRLGFDRWTASELRRQADALDRRAGVEAVRAWSGRSAATILIDPAALGRLRWLLLASPGLRAPDWARAEIDPPFSPG